MRVRLMTVDFTIEVSRRRNTQLAIPNDERVQKPRPFMHS